METGLGLDIIVNGKPASERIEVSKLIGDSHKSHRKWKWHMMNMNDLYCIGSWDRVGKIKMDFDERYGLTIEITDATGALLDDLVRIEEAQPENFIKPAINYAKLRAINELLITIEKDIHEQWERNMTENIERLQRGDTWLLDYEMDAMLRYVLSEDDPLYHENSDNTVMEEDICIFKDKWCEFGIDDTEDHSCGRRFPERDPLRQCYLFHDLYEHCRLELEDIQRIGRVFLDYKVITQHDYRV